VADDEGWLQILARDKPYQLLVGASRQEDRLWLLCGRRVGHILEPGRGRIDTSAMQGRVVETDILSVVYPPSANALLGRGVRE